METGTIGERKVLTGRIETGTIGERKISQNELRQGRVGTGTIGERNNAFRHLEKSRSAGISIQSPFPRKAAVENRIHIFKESLLEPYIVPLLGKNCFVDTNSARRM